MSTFQQQAQPQTNSASSAFPLPPMRYINAYTDDNVFAGRAPEPPKPIVDGTYSMFGVNITAEDAIIRPLEAQGIRRLYPREYDHKRELKKINASILVNFLDVLDVLVRCPDTNKREEKCADMALLFVTMHHLINELRPHQARETIRVTMQNQKKQRLDTTARLNKQIDRVNDIVQSCINSITDVNEVPPDIQSLIDFKFDIDFDRCDFNDSPEETSQVNRVDELMCSFIDEISDK